MLFGRGLERCVQRDSLKRKIRPDIGLIRQRTHGRDSDSVDLEAVFADTQAARYAAIFPWIFLSPGQPCTLDLFDLVSQG